MKTTIGIILGCLMALVARSQSPSAKIYFVKNGAQLMAPIQLATTTHPNLPITIKNNNYVLLETDSTSLGLLLDSKSGSKKRMFMPVEAGKSYYFKLGPAMYNQHIDVEEMTERAFWLYISLNDLEGTVKKYEIKSGGNVPKNQQ